MKTLTTLLLAMLLCGSALAAEVTNLAEAKKAVATSLEAVSLRLQVSNTKDIKEKLTLMELAAQASDRRAQWHTYALKAIRTDAAFAKALAAHRAAVVALPQTTETRTYLATVLDPVIKGLAAPPNDALVADLARLKAALGQ